MHFHPAHNKTVICWYSITITQIHGHNGRHDMGPRGSYNAFYGQGCCKFLMLYQIGNGLVAIPAAAYLEPVPICTRRFETRYVQIQCNTGTYSQTFFPSAIRLWNTLPADICQLSVSACVTNRLTPLSVGRSGRKQPVIATGFITFIHYTIL